MNPTLLKDLILAGHRVACKTKDGMRIVFLFINGSGRFGGTCFREFIEQCLYDGLLTGTCSEQEIQEDFTGEYKIVTPLPQLPQVGDTVEVLEICRELPGFDEWNDEMKDMVGKRGIVIYISDYGDVRVGSDGTKRRDFKSRQVAKCEPDVEPVSEDLEVIELNSKKYIELKE